MPLSNFNINIIPSDETIALAVSGGPDSVAMAYMMHEKGIKCVILTVDHNLRSESKDEALYVAQICEGLGITHHILPWIHEGITSNIHDKAREARYGLMTDWCQLHGINVLATAHHMDDRVEHFLIKVVRGAGLLGLLDHEEMIYNKVRIIRPLFNYRKSELLHFLNIRGIKYFEDKSNLDPKYLRSNIRKWLELMPKELEPDLFKKRVIGVKENLARASQLVHRIFNEELSKVVFEKDTAIISQLPQDEEIAIMLLSHILPKISGEKNPPRMESLKRLYNNLTQNNTSKTTLCRCIIERKKEKIIVTKE